MITAGRRPPSAATSAERTAPFKGDPSARYDARAWPEGSHENWSREFQGASRDATGTTATPLGGRLVLVFGGAGGADAAEQRRFQFQTERT